VLCSKNCPSGKISDQGCRCSGTTSQCRAACCRSVCDPCSGSVCAESRFEGTREETRTLTGYVETVTYRACCEGDVVGGYCTEQQNCQIATCSGGQYRATCTGTDHVIYGCTHGGSWCRSCGPGRFQSSTSHTATSCTQCVAGKYGTSTRTSCISCPSGQSSPAGSESRYECTPTCSSGEYASGSSCLDCQAGRYQSDTSHSDASCTSVLRSTQKVCPRTSTLDRNSQVCIAS